jgi:dihydropteroate synthase
MFWNLPRRPFDLGAFCHLGILNVTPDSFSDGGKSLDPKSAAEHGSELLRQGADAIDIGAESTRPGSRPVDAHEEWERLAPALARLREENPACLISIDTRRPTVARLALEAGADIINDVTGFQSAEMLALAANSNCGIIAMRIRIAGEKITMPDYAAPSPKSAGDAVRELKIVKDRLLGAGVAPGRMLLDPGFGFGTTFLEDQALWRALPEMPSLLDWPKERFCIAVSRKRFVARTFGVSGNAALDAKTAEMHKEAANIGYRVFRSHRVQSHLQNHKNG